jgi:hypothetical protein
MIDLVLITKISGDKDKTFMIYLQNNFFYKIFFLRVMAERLRKKNVDISV